MTRQRWTEQANGGGGIAVSRQCVLAGVSRATLHARQKRQAQGAKGQASEVEELFRRLIDQEYTRRPFYGSRKMAVYLGQCGHVVNRKRVQRLMRGMGLAGMAPGPCTSRPQPQHKVYPYLLGG